MKLQIITLGQMSAPWVIYNHGGSELCSLDDGLALPSVLGTISSSFRKQEINCSFLVTVATLEKRVLFKQDLEAILGRPALEELVPHSLGDQDGIK